MIAAQAAGREDAIIAAVAAFIEAAAQLDEPVVLAQVFRAAARDAAGEAGEHDADPGAALRRAAFYSTTAGVLEVYHQLTTTEGGA